jgi:hypothetical protein
LKSDQLLILTKLNNYEPEAHKKANDTNYLYPVLRATHIDTISISLLRVQRIISFTSVILGSSASGSFLAVQSDSSSTAAFERKADAFQAEFEVPWSERLLSLKAVIRSGLNERI